jgi:hypothetical protein
MPARMQHGESSAGARNRERGHPSRARILKPCQVRRQPHVCDRRAAPTSDLMGAIAAPPIFQAGATRSAPDSNVTAYRVDPALGRERHFYVSRKSHSLPSTQRRVASFPLI